MLNELRKMLGMEPGPDLGELISNGAQVIDVRSRAEYASGHLKGSINIPLSELGGQVSRINKSKPVIVCCASGMRSASAKGLLKAQGYDVHNGGGWQSLRFKVK